VKILLEMVNIRVVGFYDSPTCTDFEGEKIYTISKRPEIQTIKKDGQTNRREIRKLKRK
jgi:hypothetical protein